MPITFAPFSAGGGHREHAARAAADDENLAVDGLHDGLFVDDGRLAEPVGVVFGSGTGFGDDFDGNDALGLIDALLCGSRDGPGGDGGARDGVDARRLRGDDGLLEGLSGGLPDGGVSLEASITTSVMRSASNVIVTSTSPAMPGALAA